MIDRKIPPQIYVIVALALFLALIVSAEGLAADAHNVRLVGHYDLQQRPALQIVLKGNFAYVGHHSGTVTNPLSGKREPNGTSIVDVSDPTQPKLVHHIPVVHAQEFVAAETGDARHGAVEEGKVSFEVDLVIPVFDIFDDGAILFLTDVKGLDGAFEIAARSAWRRW